jgi:hypothetical protein
MLLLHLLLNSTLKLYIYIYIYSIWQFEEIFIALECLCDASTSIHDFAKLTTEVKDDVIGDSSNQEFKILSSHLLSSLQQFQSCCIKLSSQVADNIGLLLVDVLEEFDHKDQEMATMTATDQGSCNEIDAFVGESLARIMIKLSDNLLPFLKAVSR